MEHSTISARLNELLRSAGMEPLPEEVSAQFAAYLGLLTRWNAHLNLTAIRDEEEILRRHFVESIACARTLPAEVATVVDFGSGAGFPGIPIALCRPDIAVTLAESQSKKAAFLREVLRTLDVPGSVFSGRAETIGTTFDCVAMRAVDRMEAAVRAATDLVSTGGWLALMATHRELPALRQAAGAFAWREPWALPWGENRIIVLGHRE